MFFYIMNKDKKVIEFVCECKSGIEQIYIFNIIDESSIPLSIKNGLTIDKWIDSRLALLYRTNIAKVFKELGSTKTEDILQATKGVSLNDTYWIRPADKKWSWRSVSPYRNPLNRDIANYSFDADGKICGKNIAHSPDFATFGNYPKCWKRLYNTIYLIKGGSTFGINKGNEPYSELFANELLTRLGASHVVYSHIKYRGVDATKCANVCSEDVGIYPFNYVYPNVRNYAELLDKFRGSNCISGILDMFLFDYLSFNTDRHWGNISLFVKNDTQEVLGFTPIYDNNLAFLPYYYKELDKSIDNYIADAKGRLVTADGSTFEELFRMIDCKYVRSKIAMLKDFEFQSNFKRKDVASEVLERQLSLIKSV